MVVVIGADHGGYSLKKLLVQYVSALGHIITDIGTYNEESVDYPDYAASLAKLLVDNKADRGILICGSGVGASVAANKFSGIRAGLCHDTFSAHQGVEDDNMNVLCLGARVVGPELAKDIVLTYLNATFSRAERHIRRVEKIAQIERQCLQKKQKG